MWIIINNTENENSSYLHIKEVDSSEQSVIGEDCIDKRNQSRRDWILGYEQQKAGALLDGHERGTSPEPAATARNQMLAHNQGSWWLSIELLDQMAPLLLLASFNRGRGG